jgi:hypothetical protein
LSHYQKRLVFLFIDYWLLVIEKWFDIRFAKAIYKKRLPIIIFEISLYDAFAKSPIYFAVDSFFLL